MGLEPLIIIPARLESKRLPRKMLIDVSGRPLVVRTYLAAKECGLRVLIATDSDEIANLFNTDEVVRTSSDMTCGTDRIGEVVKILNIPDEQIIINWQGDELGITKRSIDLLIAAQKKRLNYICTLVCYESDETDENTVKVVTNISGDALYFSRSRIPYNQPVGQPTTYLKHIGIYSYPVPMLRWFNVAKPCHLELAERLEQLRALFYKLPIHVVVTPESGFAVNSQKDVDDIS